MLSHTSTEWAPWYVIPADHKWYARIATAGVMVDTLIELDPHYPRVTPDARAALQQTKVELEDQAPRGAAPDPFAQQADGAAGKAGKKARKKARKKAAKANKAARAAQEPAS